MDTTVTQTVVDYSQQLNSINDNLIAINDNLKLIANEAYWFLVVAFVVLMMVICYKILKSFY